LYADLAGAYLKAKQPTKAGEALAAGRAIMVLLVARFPDEAQWKKELVSIDQQITALKN
jgi:hypothetical protein